MRSRLWLILAGLVLAGAAIVMLGRNPKREQAEVSTATQVTAPQPPAVRAPVPASDARATARTILAALIARDGEALAGQVDARGVRLSPSAFVDVETDRVLTPSKVRKLWTDNQMVVWGNAEATGDPVLLTPASYVARYVLDHDYKSAKVSVNADTKSGSTTNNIATAYPGATSVEYFHRGKNEFDWSALRLVLVDTDAGWRLVGIVHDEWSP